MIAMDKQGRFSYIRVLSHYVSYLAMS